MYSQALAFSQVRERSKTSERNNMTAKFEKNTHIWTIIHFVHHVILGWHLGIY